MPTVQQPETFQVTTPDTGITVTFRKRATYGDSKAILASVIGESTISSEGVPTVTLAQAQDIAMARVVRLAVSWDLTEQDESAVPITAESIGQNLTDTDVNALMEAVAEPVEKRKK